MKSSTKCEKTLAKNAYGYFDVALAKCYHMFLFFCLSLHLPSKTLGIYHFFIKRTLFVWLASFLLETEFTYKRLLSAMCLPWKNEIKPKSVYSTWSATTRGWAQRIYNKKNICAWLMYAKHLKCENNYFILRR